MARISNNEFTSPVSVTFSFTIEVDGLDNDKLSEALAEFISG